MSVMNIPMLEIIISQASLALPVTALQYLNRRENFWSGKVVCLRAPETRLRRRNQMTQRWIASRATLPWLYTFDTTFEDLNKEHKQRYSHTNYRGFKEKQQTQQTYGLRPLSSVGTKNGSSRFSRVPLTEVTSAEENQKTCKEVYR